MKRFIMKSLCSTMVLAMIVGMFASVSLAAPAELDELPATAQPLATLIDSIHAELTADELADIRAARTAAEGLDSTDIALIEPIWSQIEHKFDPEVQADIQSGLFYLLVDLLTITYEENGGNILDIYNNYKSVINELIVAGNVSGGLDDADATFSELIAYMTALEAEVNVTTLLASLLDGGGFSEALEAVASEAISNMMEDPTYLISRIYAAYGITGAQVIEVKDNILGEVDSENAALTAIGLGYIRTKASLASSSTTSDSLTPQLIIRGVTIPNLLLNWTEDDSEVSYNGTSFVFSSTGSKTVSVTAAEKYTGEELVLFNGTITFDYSPSTPGGSPGGSPGGATGGNTLPDQASVVAKEVMADLAEKLADLPKDELKAELKKAEQAVEEAIKEAAKSDITTTVTAGVATATIDKTAILAKAVEAKKAADALNEDLVALGGKSVEIEFTLDLGTVDADEIKFPFDKAFMNDMAGAGIDSITVLVNGVQITVDTNEFGADTTLDIQKKSNSESGDNSGKRAASDYYDFSFSSEGSNVEEFKFPVLVKIPVNNVGSFDSELLTLAKVENGQLIYYVGKYNEESGSVEGSRDSFSTYVVVENKVAFNDITSVKSWAGRSIEVAAAKGVLAGRGDGVFDPSANVTRAEFAKMLVTAFSLSSFNTNESFSDVSDNQWFKPYVATAFSNGIISGRTVGTFDPNASITRQEMAAMIARILKSSLDATDATDAAAELSRYSDANEIGSVFQASVALATEQGILTGSAGTFKPLGITTRAEAAVVISKLIDLL